MSAQSAKGQAISRTRSQKLDLAHPAASRSDVDYLLEHANALLQTPLTREDVAQIFQSQVSSRQLDRLSRRLQARGEGYFRLEWKLAVDRTHLRAQDEAFLLPVVIDDTPDH